MIVRTLQTNKSRKYKDDSFQSPTFTLKHVKRFLQLFLQPGTCSRGVLRNPYERR